MFVEGATAVATNLGVSEAVIGLTIVAGGTSLPELATSVVSARKGNSGIAIGNALGSNVFNILAILGITGMITPNDIERYYLYRPFYAGYLNHACMALLVYEVQN